MAFTSTAFLARFPEFSGITPPPGGTADLVIQTALDDFDADTSEDFDTNRDRAVYLQTAHQLALRYRINIAPYGINNQSHVGVSTGKQVAGHSVSEQFALPANLMQWRGDWRGYYSRTQYGLEYLALCEKSLSNGITSF